MTTNEIITELLQYDGYTKDVGTHSITYISEIDNECYRTVISNEYAQTYLTDLNILHRLAVKVVDEAKEMLHKSDVVLWDLAEVRGDVISAMFTSPNPQGEHINLATAIVNAIRYISANKA